MSRFEIGRLGLPDRFLARILFVLALRCGLELFLRFEAGGLGLLGRLLSRIPLGLSLGYTGADRF